MLRWFWFTIYYSFGARGAGGVGFGAGGGAGSSLGAGGAELDVLWGCWNALKFILMGPISVVLLVRVRIREAMIRRDQRREARAAEREALVLA